MSSSSISSVISTPLLPTYPLNSFSGGEAAIKASAIMFAFLCVGGVVAVSMGGQFFLPEVLMTPIHQIMIESVLGLTSITLLIQALILSVKSTVVQADHPISPEDKSEEAQRMIQELKGKIAKLENPPMKFTARQIIHKQTEKIAQLEEQIGVLKQTPPTHSVEIVEKRVADPTSRKKLLKLQKDISRLAKEKWICKTRLGQAHNAQLKTIQAQSAKKISELTNELDKANENLASTLVELENFKRSLNNKPTLDKQASPFTPVSLNDLPFPGESALAREEQMKKELSYEFVQVTNGPKVTRDLREIQFEYRRSQTASPAKPTTSLQRTPSTPNLGVYNTLGNKINQALNESPRMLLDKINELKQQAADEEIPLSTIRAHKKYIVSRLETLKSKGVILSQLFPSQ